MKLKRWMPWVVLALAALSLALVTGASASSAKPTSKHAAIKVGLVTDIGGLNDRGFNHLAYVGLQQAVKQLGVQGAVSESKSGADYIPNLSTFAQQGDKLVIGVGFLMTDQVDQMAVKFPNVTFAGVDISINDLKDKPSNFIGITFKEQESGFVAGYLAGLMIDYQHLSKVASTVGGIKLPAVDRYIAGYIAGLHRADPKIKELNSYAQTFTDLSKCKEIALNQIAQGSSVVFAVAGGCGNAALDAAKEKHKWGIGVDSDQLYFGPHMLTSAIKKVDAGVFNTIKAVDAGTSKPGADQVYGVAQGAAGIGKISPKVPQSIVAKVLALQAKMKAGKIKNIPTTVK